MDGKYLAPIQTRTRPQLSGHIAYKVVHDFPDRDIRVYLHIYIYRHMHTTSAYMHMRLKCTICGV